MAALSKGLLVILDGLGDLPSPALGGKTPLEAAATPVLDEWADRGVCGTVDPLFPGSPVGTQTGCGALMGMALRDLERLARGPVEAAGVGLALEPGEIALHGNFATLAKDGVAILDRRAGRIDEGTHELAAAVDGLELDGVTTRFRAATQHRAVLALRGPGLSPAVSDTDPGAGAPSMRVLPCAPQVKGKAATRTAALLNRWTREAQGILAGHPVNRGRDLPANGILLRGAGLARDLASRVTHLGLRTAVVAAECTVVGLARFFRYTVVSDPRFTALPDTDLDAKVAAACEALEDHDLVYLHIKGADICAHDKDPVGKKEFLERADAALAAAFSEELVIGVTADHSTDSGTGRHSGDPVPSLLYGPRVRRDGCATFGERACAAGGQGRIPSIGYLGSFLDAMGASKNFRPQDTAFIVPC